MRKASDAGLASTLVRLNGNVIAIVHFGVDYSIARETGHEISGGAGEVRFSL